MTVEPHEQRQRRKQDSSEDAHAPRSLQKEEEKAARPRYYLKEDHHKVDHQQRSDFLAALLDLLQHTLPRRFQRRLVHLFRLLNF